MLKAILILAFINSVTGDVVVIDEVPADDMQSCLEVANELNSSVTIQDKYIMVAVCTEAGEDI